MRAGRQKSFQTFKIKIAIILPNKNYCAQLLVIFSLVGILQSDPHESTFNLASGSVFGQKIRIQLLKKLLPKADICYYRRSFVKYLYICK
jgi:hypothetical protein